MRCGRGGVTVVQPPPPRIRILGFISKQVKRSIILSEITKSLLGRNGGLGRNDCSYGFWDVSQNSQRRRGRDVLWAECCTAGIVIWTTCTWYTTMLAKRRWLGGAVVRALDLRLEVAGSIPAAALSSATLDKLFTHIVQRLWCYNLMAQYKSKQKKNCACELQKFLSAADYVGQLSGQLSGAL